MEQTPLFEEYARHGARVVDFHGWALPVQFSGIVEEHLHTRARAGLFDCSHMGEFMIRGRAGVAALDTLVCGDMVNLREGRCRYTALLNAEGGVVDDCVALRLAEEELLLVTNAGPLAEVSEWLREAIPGVEDISAGMAKIDVQGPASREVLLALGLAAAGPLKYWTGCRTVWEGTELMVTRAGYTGELGYELYLPASAAAEVWRKLVAHEEVKPCGLGARDTLRTEAGYPLNGQDVTPETTALEAGMERFIAWETVFPGKERLLDQRESGGYSVLTAVVSPDRRAPRPGFEVRREGTAIGQVTSGTFGPSVGRGVGLAMLPLGMAAGTALTAGPREMAIETADIPVYKGGTCRMRVDG